MIFFQYIYSLISLKWISKNYFKMWNSELKKEDDFISWFNKTPQIFVHSLCLSFIRSRASIRVPEYRGNPEITLKHSLSLTYD